MCVSFFKFLKSVKEFHLTLKETRENLSDIKTILQGALKITGDIENVTEEVGNVVEFYAKESKKAIRDQLSSTMSLEGREKLSHNDFMKSYKTTFETEILYLIDNHTSKQARTAIVNIICQQEDFATDLELQFEKTAFKVFTLQEVTKYLKESISLYQRGHIDINSQTDGSLDNSSNNIRLFCDKQRIIEKLEQMLHTYCYTNIEEINQHEELDKYCMQKSTRVKKLRHYLKSRIRLKKIGKFYKEEISFQLSVDLKKAAHNIWEVEENLAKQCNSFVEMLQQLPKERFANVLHEEYTINVSDIMQKFNKRKMKSEFEIDDDTSTDMQYEKKTKLSEQTSPTTHESEIIPTIHERKKIQYLEIANKHGEIYSDKGTSPIQTVNVGDEIENGTNFDVKSPASHESSPVLTATVMTNDVLEDAVIIPNEDKPIESISSNEIAEKSFTIKNGLSKTKNQIPNCYFEHANFEKIGKCNVGKISVKVDTDDSSNDNGDKNTLVYKPKLFRKTIVIDPILILDDADKIFSPVWNIMARKAFNYTMKSIEESHIAIGHAFDVAEHIETFVRDDDLSHLGNKRNVFTDKLLDICLCDFSKDNRYVMKKFVENVLYSKENRAKLYDVLQRKFPDVIDTITDTCATVFKEIEYS